jgi:hypothetical protein
VLSPERRFGACPEILSTGLDATKAKTIIQTTMDIFAGWRIGLGAKETKTFFTEMTAHHPNFSSQGWRPNVA